MASANPGNLTVALANALLNGKSAKVLLVSGVPSEANLDAWANRSDVTNEITGTGYTAGGISQAFSIGAYDSTNNRVAVTLTNITNGWTSASFSAVGAWVYIDNGSAATDTLLHFVDFGGTVTCTAGNFSITYSTPFYINR